MGGETAFQHSSLGDVDLAGAGEIPQNTALDEEINDPGGLGQFHSGIFFNNERMRRDRTGKILLTGQTQNAFAKKHAVDFSADQSLSTDDMRAGETGSRFHRQFPPGIDRPGGVRGKGQIFQLDALIASRADCALGMAGNRMRALTMIATDFTRRPLGHPSDRSTHQALGGLGRSCCCPANLVVAAAGAAERRDQLRGLLLDKSAVGAVRRYLAGSVRHEGGLGRRSCGRGFGRRRAGTRRSGT